MEIIESIEELRQQMHDLALVYGIDHPKVIEISQKLDVLINEFYNTSGRK